MPCLISHWVPAPAQELKDCSKKSESGIHAQLADESNLMHWKGEIHGPVGTAYEGGRSLDDLRKHAESLGPSCSVDNKELCSAEQWAQLGYSPPDPKDHNVGSKLWQQSILRRNALGNAIALPVLRRLLCALRDSYEDS